MDDARRCRATNRSGERCGRPAAPGAVVCASHGAKAPQASRRAARRRLEAQAVRLVGTEVAIIPVTDPIEALCAIAGEALALRDLLRAQVAALGDVTNVDRAGVEHTRALLDTYGTALDRAERTCHNLARLGIEDRLARVSEAQVELIFAALQRVVTSRELALNADQHVVFRRLAAFELRAVAAAGGTSS